MKCFVGGYFGERTRPHGGTQYVRNLLENPPEGVEYILPKKKVEWLDTEYYQFLNKQKTVDASEVHYYKHLKKINRLLKWHTKELKKIKILEDEIDLIFYNQGIILSNQPYVSSIEGDYLLTNNPQYSPFKEIDMNTPLAKIYQRTVLKRILLKKNLKKILFWSNRALTESLRLFPEIEHKSCVLYPSVNVPEKSRRRERDNVKLLFIGGDWIRKGLMLLTEVYSKLKNKYDVELSVVTEESIQVAELGDGINVFHGLPFERVFPGMYSDSDIFVLPTRFETFGYSLLEAMACSLPVVTTDVYAIPEIVEDWRTGYLTPYGDVNALEEKLIELIEDSSLRRKMGKAGRKKVKEKFSVPVFREKIGGIFEESIRD